MHPSYRIIFQSKIYHRKEVATFSEQSFESVKGHRKGPCLIAMDDSSQSFDDVESQHKSRGLRVCLIDGVGQGPAAFTLDYEAIMKGQLDQLVYGACIYRQFHMKRRPCGHVR